jgi:hypothetical protein
LFRGSDSHINIFGCRRAKDVPRAIRAVPPRQQTRLTPQRYNRNNMRRCTRNDLDHLTFCRHIGPHLMDNRSTPMHVTRTASARHAFTVIPAAAALLFALGCQSREVCSPTPAANYKALGIVNGKCPIMNVDGVDGTTTVNFQGKKVGFCCGHCVDDWRKLTEDQQAKLVAKVMD